MSFRQYGGINYAARNNIVKNNYTNANNLSVMNKVGQPDSIINFDSDIAFKYIGAPTYGIYFSDGSFQDTAYLGTDSNWTRLDNNIYNNNTGNVGIGTFTPSKKLEVSGSDALINGITVGIGSGNNNNNNNTAVGYETLKDNTSGTRSTAIGSQSLYKNTDGYQNTAVGVNSMHENTLSYNNTAFGMNALYSQVISGTLNGSGGWTSYDGDNTAIGVSSLYFTNGAANTGGSSGTRSGSWNTAVGLNALRYNTTGYYNTAIGVQAGVYFNASTGQPAASTDGGPNTAIRCTFLGSETRCNSNLNPINSTALGHYALITASNQIMMGGDYTGTGTGYPTVYVPGTMTVNGNGNTTSTNLTVTGKCQATSFNNPSDYRIKENVLALNKSSFTVDNLQPVTYTNILSGKQDMGFIAHELQEHYPFLVTGEKDGTDNQSVNYISLIALLVKEIQELKQDIKILKTK